MQGCRSRMQAAFLRGLETEIQMTRWGSALSAIMQAAAHSCSWRTAVGAGAHDSEAADSFRVVVDVGAVGQQAGVIAVNDVVDLVLREELVHELLRQHVRGLCSDTAGRVNCRARRVHRDTCEPRWRRREQLWQHVSAVAWSVRVLILPKSAGVTLVWGRTSLECGRG